MALREFSSGDLIAEPGAARAGHPSARVAWTAVVVLAMMYALSFLDRQIISLLVAPIRHDLGISDSKIGLLQGFAFALLYSVCGMPLGFAVDRLPRRWVIYCGVTIWAAAACACGLARTFPQLLAARFLVGMGEAALAPAAYSMLSDLFPRGRLTFALSMYSVGALLGSALSLSFGAVVIHWFENGLTVPILGHIASWQAAFLITGLPGFVIALLIFTIPEPVRHSHGGTSEVASWADFFRFIRTRGLFFTCHVVGFAAILAMAYATIFWAPTFLARTYGWPITKVGLILAGFSFITGLIAFLFSGPTVDAMVRRNVTDAHFRFYVFATVVSGACGVVAYQSRIPWLFFLLSAFAAVALNMSAISAAAIQIVTPPALRGRVSAAYLMISALAAMTLGGSTVSWFTDHVFHSDAKIGASMSATYLLFAPIAFLAFFIGLKPMRKAVELAVASGRG
jgi:MFS family permease